MRRTTVLKILVLAKYGEQLRQLELKHAFKECNLGFKTAFKNHRTNGEVRQHGRFSPQNGLSPTKMYDKLTNSLGKVISQNCNGLCSKKSHSTCGHISAHEWWTAQQEEHQVKQRH